MMHVAPHNVMQSFELVKIAGFSSCITNINMTGDNILVALHDDTIDGTSNGTGNVADYTYDELLDFDFGSWFHPVYTGTKIPKIEEVMSWASMSSIHLIVRLNSAWTDNSTGVYTQLLNFAKKYHMLKNISFKAFDLGVLDACYDVFGDNAHYIYCPNSDITENMVDSVKTRYGSIENITLEPPCVYLTETGASYAIAENIEVSAYTVNDIAMMRELTSWGVTRFCTDTFSDIVFPAKV
jgi:glycerophosphoryl diester phosphodiesterase